MFSDLLRKPAVWGVGLTLAAAGSFFQGQIEQLFKSVAPNASCQAGEYWQEAKAKLFNVRSPPDKLVVLIARFEDDPANVQQGRIRKIFYGAPDFAIYESCKRFQPRRHSDFATAPQAFMTDIADEMRKKDADIVIFGTIDAGSKVKVWMGNLFGGCGERKAIDLDAANAEIGISQDTRSKLLSAAAQNVFAACNDPEKADWTRIARKVEQISAYLDKQKDEIKPADYDNIQLHIFGVSFAQYSGHADDRWFERARRGLESWGKGNEAIAPTREALLAALWHLRFKHTRSHDALARSVSAYRSVAASRGWTYFKQLEAVADVVGAMEAGFEANVGGVTREELEAARAALAQP